MSKILQGKVISNKMQNTAVVEVVRVVAHPLYRKLLKKSKKYKVDTLGQKLEAGMTVKIIETRPIAKGKHFKLLQAGLPAALAGKPSKGIGKADAHLPAKATATKPRQEKSAGKKEKV